MLYHPSLLIQTGVLLLSLACLLLRCQADALPIPAHRISKHMHPRCAGARGCDPAEWRRCFQAEHCGELRNLSAPPARTRQCTRHPPCRADGGRPVPGVPRVVVVVTQGSVGAERRGRENRCRACGATAQRSTAQHDWATCAQLMPGHELQRTSKRRRCGLHASRPGSRPVGPQAVQHMPRSCIDRTRRRLFVHTHTHTHTPTHTHTGVPTLLQS